MMSEARGVFLLRRECMEVTGPRSPVSRPWARPPQAPSPSGALGLRIVAEGYDVPHQFGAGNHGELEIGGA